MGTKYQFKVFVVDGTNTICLESVLHPGYYIGLSYDHDKDRQVVKIKRHAGPPVMSWPDANYYFWKVWGSSLDSVSFQSVMMPGRWLEWNMQKFANVGNLVAKSGPTDAAIADEKCVFTISVQNPSK